jgi:hypothetical protein
MTAFTLLLFNFLSLWNTKQLIFHAVAPVIRTPTSPCVSRLSASKRGCVWLVGMLAASVNLSLQFEFPLFTTKRFV